MAARRVPIERINIVCHAPVNDRGAFVLYWMIAQRRLRANFGLQRALEWAQDLGKPLMIFEPLRVGYPWASHRFHRFVIDGMADHAKALEGSPVGYFPYVERAPTDGAGLLANLSEKACVVVTDEYPGFFLPRMVGAAARESKLRMEAVDGNGLLPLAATEERVFLTAHSFRRFLQKELLDELPTLPKLTPLRGLELPACGRIPAAIVKRWKPPTLAELEEPERLLHSLALDREVRAVAQRGGEVAGQKIMKGFLSERLARYAADRNHLLPPVTSGLSPYLHFGHIGSHQLIHRVLEQGGWTRDQLSPRADGRRSGWWGLGESSEAFLDQLIVWRELGFNMAFLRPESDGFESLPPWAIQTLEQHAADERPRVYSLDEFEEARTHDPLWNAAQRQLVQDGVIHNYLRMLWGKKILEWSASPRDALSTMIQLNNKYALDGRDPNSNSGIFWTLGRYDRPWGPERPIFGKIRFMSSANTARKIDVKAYVARYAQAELFG